MGPPALPQESPVFGPQPRYRPPHANGHVTDKQRLVMFECLVRSAADPKQQVNEYKSADPKLQQSENNNNNAHNNNNHHNHNHNHQQQTTHQDQQNQQQQQLQAKHQERNTPGRLRKFTLDCLLELLKVIINLYDLISGPVWYLSQGVARRRRELEQTVLSRKWDPTDPDSAWRQVDIDPRHLLLEQRIDSHPTYDRMMQAAFRSFGERPCYGFRQVVGEQWSVRPDTGKPLRQVQLTDYRWVSCASFERQIEAARRGFLLEGVRFGERVMLFADTRPEWQIASQALLRLGAVVCTMYSTLGVEGIVHSVNECEVSHVVTQRDKIDRLLGLKAQLPKLTKVIYFELNLELSAELGGQLEYQLRGDKQHHAPLKGQTPALLRQQQPPAKLEAAHAAGVQCVSFARLLERGLAAGSQSESDEGKQVAELDQEANAKLEARSKDSLAVIMYTSGSTGVPKGVLISHGNIMATVKAFSYVTKDFVCKPLENTCTAYLPLAHIFEFCIESVMLFHGVRYGFASPHTLTDKSPGLAPGQRGDLGLLRPTVMIIVPLILDRILMGVKQALAAESYFKSRLVSHLLDYKIYWQERHYDTPLVDKLICSKIAAALGGRARYVISGSAPLSSATQRFVRAALNLHLPQGFGTTETCAATACQLFGDTSTGNVGLPVAGCQVRLEPWLEGNYTPSDTPNPRGEIVVGGQMIAHGYFKLEEQTNEAFYTDAAGVRWYRTGDIGEFLPNGNLRIIDRKKDLVKLQNGEYISLGKVESTLKSNPYLDNFCVYADSHHNYVVALGPVNQAAVRQLAAGLVAEHLQPGESAAATQSLMEPLAELAAELKVILESTEDATDKDKQLERLCNHQLVQGAVLAALQELARQRGLLTLEVPRKVLLLADEWTEDSNLVTAAMKIRRNYIYRRYQAHLDALYARP